MKDERVQAFNDTVDDLSSGFPLGSQNSPGSDDQQDSTRNDGSERRFSPSYRAAPSRSTQKLENQRLSPDGGAKKKIGFFGRFGTPACCPMLAIDRLVKGKGATVVNTLPAVAIGPEAVVDQVQKSKTYRELGDYSALLIALALNSLPDGSSCCSWNRSGQRFHQ